MTEIDPPDQPGGPPPSTPSTPPPPSAPASPPPPPTTPVDAAAGPSPYEPAPPAAVELGRSRRTGRVAAAVVAVVAVVAAGFAVMQLASADGADSPEAAVEALLDAVANEDVIGVLEALPAGERDVFRPAVEDLTAELSRLGVASDDIDLESFQGIDITIEDVETRSEEVGEGVAAVYVTGGTISTSATPSELPIGPTLDEWLADAGVEVPTEAVTEDDDLDTGETPITVVEDGDGWHVSLWYTIFESARREAGAEVPDFASEVLAPEGADSPEGVIEAMIERLVDLDVEGAVALLPPDEMAAAYDYVPVLLDDQTRDELAGTTDLTVSDVSLRTEEDGDTARVTVDSFTVTGEVDGTTGTITWSDGCLVSEPDDPSESSFNSCDEGIALDTEVALTVVEVDGRWYLSPTRSITGPMIDYLRSLDDDLSLEDIGGILEGFTGSLAEESYSDEYSDEYSDDSSMICESIEEFPSIEQYPSSADGDAPVDSSEEWSTCDYGVDGDWEDVGGPYMESYDSTAAAVASCLTGATATVDESDTPVLSEPAATCVSDTLVALLASCDAEDEATGETLLTGDCATGVFEGGYGGCYSVGEDLAGEMPSSDDPSMSEPSPFDDVATACVWLVYEKVSDVGVGSSTDAGGSAAGSPA